MSILAKHLRPLIVSNLREDMNPRIKKAMMELFNAIDVDLDEQNYSLENDTVNSTVEEALDRLTSLMESFNIPEEDDALIAEESTPILALIEEDDDSNSSKYKGGSEEPG